MIRLIENYDFSSDIVTELPTEEWHGRDLLDLIPAEFREDEGITLQVCHNDRELDTDQLGTAVICDGDTVKIRAVAQAAAVGVFLVTTIVGLAIGYGIQAIINAIIGPPKKPKKDKEESPTYDFGVPQNTTENGTPVAIVYGQVPVAGQVLQAKTYTLPDGRTGIRILLSLGEGGTNGWDSICGLTVDQNLVTPPDSLKINGNIASTYKNILFSTRLGTAHQGIIPNFEDIVVLTTGFDIVLPYNSAQTYSGTNKCDSLELKLRFASGLFALTSKGNLVSKTVSFSIRWKVQGTSTWVGPFTVTITRAQRSEFTYTYRIDNRNNSITDVEITRLTTDDSATTMSSVFSLYQVDEILSDDLAYPGLVLLGIEALATDQLHGAQPNISCLAKGLKVRVYADTINYSIQWSNNPAWVIFDLMTNKKYGLGKWIEVADIDIQSFIDFARYCDQTVLNGNGQSEVRHTCNIAIDESRKAWDWVYDLCQAFQASIYEVGGTYRIEADQASTPVMMFTPGNSYNVRFGYTAKNDRVNYINATYPDETMDYRRNYIVALDESVTDNSLYQVESIELLPITRRNEAQRVANYRINANNYLTRYAIWECGIAALRCAPNSVVELAYPVVGWGLYSGLVSFANSTSITFDQDIVVQAGHNYVVRVFQEDGTFEQKALTSSAGTFRQIAVVGTWQVVPARYRPFVIVEITQAVKQFKIVDITRQADKTFKIHGIEYNPIIYSDTVLPAPTGNVGTGFDPAKFPDDVVNLDAQERTALLPDGGLERVIDVSWELPIDPTFDHADLWVKAHADTDWPITPTEGVIKGNYFPLRGTFQQGDVLDIAVTSASVFGMRKHPSLAPQVTLTISTSTRQPANVANFQVIRYGDNFTFTWDANTDGDIAFYELRYAIGSGGTWESSQLIAKTAATSFDTAIFFSGTTAYDTTFMIKAVNTSGNYSVSATAVVTTVDPKIDQNIVIFNNYRTLDWAGTKTNFTTVGSSPNKTLQITTSGTVATFETAEIDVGSILRSRVTTYLVATQIDSALTWANAAFTWGSTTAQQRTWSGPLSSSVVTSKVQWKFGTTSGSGSYADFFPQEQTFRYCRFKVSLDVTDIQYGGELTEFQVTIDVPDIIDHQRLTFTGTTTVTYGKVFTQTAHIAKIITVMNGAQGDYYAITSETTSGFALTLYNAIGVQLAVSRNVDVIAKGY